jgi:Pyruvate/2-oxoacid:ferredoxin oxidoreductase gamma subunit
MDRSVRALTLRRAAEILGGPAQLRIYLNVSAICLAAWMTGVDTAPTQVFLKAVDLVMEEGATKKPLNPP